MGALFQETIFDATCTGSVSGAGFDVPDVTMLKVHAVISAGSGTITDCDVYLEDSLDGGVTWRPMLALRGEDNGTEFTTARINIINNKVTNTAQSGSGLYDHVPASKIRARVTLTGTTPSLPIKVYAEGK